MKTKRLQAYFQRSIIHPLTHLLIHTPLYMILGKTLMSGLAVTAGPRSVKMMQFNFRISFSVNQKLGFIFFIVIL